MYLDLDRHCRQHRQHRQCIINQYPLAIVLSSPHSITPFLFLLHPLVAAAPLTGPFSPFLPLSSQSSPHASHDRFRSHVALQADTVTPFFLVLPLSLTHTHTTPYFDYPQTPSYHNRTRCRFYSKLFSRLHVYVL